MKVDIKTKAEIDRVNLQIEDAKRRSDYGKAAELQYGTLPALTKKLEEAEKKSKNGTSLLRDEVTSDEIAKIVSKWTGIPVTKLMESEKEKLLPTFRRGFFLQGERLSQFLGFTLYKSTCIKKLSST